MVLQLQEAGVFKDELNLHVHLVQYICWQAYILEALHQKAVFVNYFPRC
jgi:hypothetical protein